MRKPQKEAYFTPGTITSKSREMRQALENLVRRQPVSFSPGQAALLVLDLQSYFLDPASHAFIPSGAAILPGVNSLIQAFARRDLPLVFTRHLNTPEDAGLMAVWWRDLITPEDPLSQIDPRLEMAGGVTIPKTRYDAFLYSDLEDYLRKQNIRQVLICGVMTHLCCETTARSAFMRGFEVFFAIDGTATYNEAFHRASLLNLAHGFAVPVLVGDILDWMEASGHG